MEQQFSQQYAQLGIKGKVPADLTKKAEKIYQAACKKLGINPENLPGLSKVRGKYKATLLATHKLMIIRDALTEGKEADWDNDEEKWEPWFWFNAPGFRFDYADCGYTYSSVGSRLCFFSQEDAQFSGQECIALWADLYGDKLPS